MSLLGSLFGEEAALGWYTDKNASNTGKTIGYRRVSGKVGLTDNENGVRGAWVEKRVALFKKLLDNNYKIALLSQPTDQTEAEGVEFSTAYKPVDVLILEFGGTNIQFYKKYWDATVEMINEHRGRIIFINDDPDLSFLWELLPNEDWSRWTIAANATNTSEVAKTLKVPLMRLMMLLRLLRLTLLHLLLKMLLMKRLMMLLLRRRRLLLPRRLRTLRLLLLRRLLEMRLVLQRLL